MSASPGFTGGVRAQAHLKAVLGGVLAVVFPYPEVVVARAGAVFTDGVLTDETTAGFVQAFADAFVPWVQGQKAS
jgi:chromate reductase